MIFRLSSPSDYRREELVNWRASYCIVETTRNHISNFFLVKHWNTGDEYGNPNNRSPCRFSITLSDAQTVPQLVATRYRNPYRYVLAYHVCSCDKVGLLSRPIGAYYMTNS